MRSRTQVIVVGAGHAGCEAALAAARSGCETILFTINLDMVASMPCNPSIGGQGKGQLVREIDALGGEMGKIADATRIQARRLNTRKGYAVQANRFQSDKEAYGIKMLQVLQDTSNLSVIQGLVTELFIDGNKVLGIKTLGGETYFAEAIIITTGTFLRGRIHIGETSFEAGRAGEPSAEALGISLENAGLPIVRFKTGTPPRLDLKTIDFSGLEEQFDDPLTPMFSIWSDPAIHLPLKSCFITRTNRETHEVIRKNIGKSALIAGLIKGPGPRYCPSIEDKISKFPERDSHKIFLEPEGAFSREIYLQGMSTSLPEDVQEEYVRTIKGLENARISRPGYGIEYDIVDPSDLLPNLRSGSFDNLFLAGQINGTSGYEEAAAQGLVAGINASALVRGKESLILKPENSYTGLMIQEISTQGISEPYRVFTSRSPFRLQLRMSNAEERLSEIGYRCGVISPEKIKLIRKRLENISGLEKSFGTKCFVPGKLVETFPEKIEKVPNSSISCSQLLKRPEFELKDFLNLFPEIGELDRLARMEIEARIKYSGYLKQQEREFNLRNTFSEMEISSEFIESLPEAVCKEARLNIQAARPRTLGALASLPGVRASDVAVILMKIKKENKKVNV